VHDTAKNKQQTYLRAPTFSMTRARVWSVFACYVNVPSKITPIAWHNPSGARSSAPSIEVIASTSAWPISLHIQHITHARSINANIHALNKQVLAAHGKGMLTLVEAASSTNKCTFLGSRRSVDCAANRRASFAAASLITTMVPCR